MTDRFCPALHCCAPYGLISTGMSAFLKTPWGIGILVTVVLLLSTCSGWMCWRKCRKKRKPKHGRRRRADTEFSDYEDDDEKPRHHHHHHSRQRQRGRADTEYSDGAADEPPCHHISSSKGAHHPGSRQQQQQSYDKGDGYHDRPSPHHGRSPTSRDGGAAGKHVIYENGLYSAELPPMYSASPLPRFESTSTSATLSSGGARGVSADNPFAASPHGDEDMAAWKHTMTRGDEAEPQGGTLRSWDPRYDRVRSADASRGRVYSADGSRGPQQQGPDPCRYARMYSADGRVPPLPEQRAALAGSRAGRHPAAYQGVEQAGHEAGRRGAGQRLQRPAPAALRYAYSEDDA